MILIGQYDSPFVRRVGIALRLYGFPFEHRPWSVGADAAAIGTFNPLRRVPVLVLESGESLIETFAILDHLDALAPAGKALIAREGPDRRAALRIMALASGLSDKAVSLFYEQVFHGEISQSYAERCRTQMAGALDALESAAGVATSFLLGERLTHADIAMAAAVRHAREAHPGLVTQALHRVLCARCDLLEADDVFRDISQPFVPPA